MSKGYGILAGKFRHRVEIQNEAETTDSIGYVSISYVTAKKVWASIVTLNGSELVEARQIYPKATNKIRMRYVAGLTERARIKHGDNIYNIDFIDDVDQRHKVFVITATQNKGTTGDSTTI